jgi:hypothetical protein
LRFVYSEDWITLSTLAHIIALTITPTHGQIINIVIATNEIWLMYNDLNIKPDSLKINKRLVKDIYFNGYG